MSPHWNFLLAILVALLTGGFATQLLSAFTDRKTRELGEATALSNIKTDIMVEIRKENLALEEKLGLVAQALIIYTDTVDSFINRVEGIPDDERATLRQAGNKARLVLSRLVA